MFLDDLADDLHDTSVAKGFYDDADITSITWQLSKLALIASEVSETLEALRKEQGEYKVVEEIADILIRTLDFYSALRDAGVVISSLDDVLNTKAAKNKVRPQMHGVLA